MKNKNAHTSRFDIAITNPPYCRDLHLRIIEKVIPHCEEVLNISPIRWLRDPLAKYKKNSSYNKFKESVAEHIKDFEYVVGRDVFDADLGTIAVVLCDKNNYDIYKDINMRKSAFYKIIDGLTERMSSVMIEDDFDGLCCSAPLIVIGNKSEYCKRKNGWLAQEKSVSYYKNKKNEATGETYYEYRKMVCWGNNKPKDKNWNVKFETEEERDNFYDSFHTTIMRWFFCEQSVGVNVNINFLPWMGNVEDGYKSPWTDERFKDYFNITDEEWKEIEETMNEICKKSAL